MKLTIQTDLTINMRISIIIPVLNEAALVVQNLSVLQPLRAVGHELILVDGGSDDTTLPLSEPFVDQTVQSSRDRSRQMNNGAKVAKGEIFLFLHIDTLLPEGADQLIVNGMEKEKRRWGRFDVRLSGSHFLLRIVEWLMNWRSRITGIATGDQAIFVKREIFEAIGGFPDISLMEDIALSKSLKKHGPPLCLPQRVKTSSRRWEKKGILRIILLMWFLRLAYFLGIDPKRLARLYDPLTHPSSSETMSQYRKNQHFEKGERRSGGKDLER
jgi:rSAM/selenodomain-associated transferase 2